MKLYICFLWVFLSFASVVQGKNTLEIHSGLAHSGMNCFSLTSKKNSTPGNAFTSSGLMTGFSLANAPSPHSEASMQSVFHHPTYPNHYNRNYRINDAEKSHKDSLPKQIYRKTSFYAQVGWAISIVRNIHGVYTFDNYNLYLNSLDKTGIELALQLNHSFSKNFSLNLGLCYNSRKIKYHLSELGMPLLNAEIDYDVKASYCGLPILFQIEEYTEKNKIFFQIGPQVGRYFSLTGTEVITRSNPVFPTTRTENKIHDINMPGFPIRVWEFGLCAGIGVRDIPIGKQHYIIGVRAIPWIFNVNNNPYSRSYKPVCIHAASFYLGIKI